MPGLDSREKGMDIMLLVSEAELPNSWVDNSMLLPSMLERVSEGELSMAELE
jgi:hypothetical protein